MSSFYLPITLVRWPNRDAAEKLNAFVFGGRYVGERPQRGFDPEFVSYWIRENVPATSSPIAVRHVLEILRFYDRADVLDHLGRFLTRKESDVRSLSRSLYVTQCIGELGTVDQCRAVSNYFAEFIVPHPAAMDLFPIVLDAAESMAQTVDIGGVGRRLQTAINTAAKAPDLEGTGGIPFRKYSDYANNQYQATVSNIQVKQRILATPPAQRLQELTALYLGESPNSGPAMEIFAGRLIRAFAIDGGHLAVHAAFSQIIDAAARSQMDKTRKEFIIHRAAQAIIYLQGKLTNPQEALYESIEDPPANFLWDDPGAPAYPV